MADWRWEAYDLASGAATATLPISSWWHEDLLNDAGQFNATVVPASRVDLDRATVAALEATRSLIVPVRNGLPLGYAGVVWGPDLPQITGASLLSYFDDQTYDTTHTWASADQHTMLRDLVDWVQANGGNIQVDTTQVAASGVLRDQTWHVWEQKNVGEAFRQKADNIDGFDFDFRVELDAGVLVRRLRMWTPRRGRPYMEGASPVFRAGQGGNVRSIPAMPVNGGKMVTHVVAVGAETGTVVTIGDAEIRERLVARATRTGWPRLAHKLDLPDVKDQATLQAHADGWLYFYGTAAVDEIIVDVDPDYWGSWETGDDCMLAIPTGISPWLPDGYSGIRRIVAHRWAKTADHETLEVVTGRVLA